MKNWCALRPSVLLQRELLYHDKVAHHRGRESILLAEDLYQHTLQSLVEKKFITDEELIMSHEIDNDSIFKVVEREKDESDYKLEEKKSKSLDFISIDYKIKVINIEKSHSKWS